MSRHQIRLLLCSAASAALIVGALFVLEWFRIDLGSAQIAIDLRNARMCAPGSPCTTVELSSMTGFYPVIASAAYWCALPLALLVLGQCAARVMTGSASVIASRIGYVLGVIAFLAAFGAGYLFGPEPDTMFDVMGVMGTRTFAAPMLLSGILFGLLALRYALADEVDEGEYRPIIVDRDAEGRIPVTPLHVKQVAAQEQDAAQPATRAKVPSSPPAVARTTSPQQPLLARTMSPLEARTRAPSSPPAVARTTSPQHPVVARTASPQLARTKSPSSAGRTRSAQGSEPPIDAGGSLDLPSRTRTSSSGPIDLAARLSGAPLSVAIKPPLPEPDPVPPDQIPVAPESGLVIRKRTQSAAPLSADQIPIAPESGLVIRTKSPSAAPPARVPASSGAMAPIEMPAVEMPAPLVLNYAVATATLTRMGISAQREDGSHKQVAWDAVIGVIARRLPSEAPYDGATFVDVVSSAGATLRFLPWTQIDGAPILGEGEERARAFVQLVAARCLDAKLDSWTKVFADGGGRAAQLPSAKTLAAHDDKLA
jgi:hypothetical protein